jgi:hypothetical protein
MSSGHFHDDDFDPSPPRPSSGSPVLIIALVAGVLVVLAAVCGGFALFWTHSADRAAEQRAAVVAEAGATRAAGLERERAAEETAEDRSQADYLARHAALARDRDAGIPARYRQLTPAQQAAVDDLREAVARRPAVELSDGLRAIYRDRLDFLKHTDILAYRLALADQNGGRELARRLKLVSDPAILFRLAYGEELPDRRTRVRAAIERSLETGLSSLSDDELKLLQPYREYLRRVPK